MLKFLDRIISILGLAAGLGLLGACSAPYINPNTTALPSLLGLAYPYLLPANLLLTAYWIFRRKRRFWAGLAVLLAAIPSFTGYYGCGGRKEGGTKPDISLLSYNVRYFDQLNWTGRKDTRSRLISYLNGFKGDIICLQEAAMKRYPETTRRVVRGLNTYPYRYIYREMAIFSRLPILSKGTLPFDKRHSGKGIWCTVRLDRDTVCIYNVHLESYKLGYKERDMLKEPGNTKEQLSLTTRHIGGRLIQANRHRALQTAILERHIANNPHPVILCGDFNDTPVSYTYRRMTSRLKDSFTEKGRGLGNTYSGNIPSLRFRLDYIMHTPEFRATSYTRGNVGLSDHYPIRTDLVMER